MSGEKREIRQIVVFVKRDPEDLKLLRGTPMLVRRIVSALSESTLMTYGPGPLGEPMSSEQVERILKEETRFRYVANNGHIYSSRAEAFEN